MLYLEDGGSMFLRHAGTYLPDDNMYHTSEDHNKDLHSCNILKSYKRHKRPEVHTCVRARAHK
jgi:hypothetical protein